MSEEIAIAHAVEQGESARNDFHRIWEDAIKPRLIEIRANKRELSLAEQAAWTAFRNGLARAERGPDLKMIDEWLNEE